MTARRLSRADRRDQLVGIARDVIAAEGTDALTLGSLAARAGVSKPVVYDHFSSRSALLLSLYEDFDRRHLADLRAEIARTPPDLRQRVEAIAMAHVECVVSQGAELGGVVAALVGTPELEKARREAERRYADICRQAMRSADGAADLGVEFSWRSERDAGELAEAVAALARGDLITTVGAVLPLTGMSGIPSLR